MEELSAALESLINGEDPALDRISEDTLPSKIQSQILRLQDKMRGSEQALAKERAPAQNASCKYGELSVPAES